MAAIQYWKDREKKTLDPEVFSKVAEEWARKISEAGGGRKNKPSQIRKFYDEVLKLDGQVKAKETAQEQESEFLALLPYLKMLNAKAAYAQARDLVTQEFKDFIDSNLKLVINREDFRIMVSFFEAFMGYFKFYSEVRPVRN